MARRVAGFGTTVFVEINDLARQCNAVNLGQGAPDFDGPSEVLAAAVKAINGELNQYAPGIGMPALREAIARHADRFCIPPSGFYQESDKYLGRYLTRFAICKKDETLAAAAERLSKLAKL